MEVQVLSSASQRRLRGGLAVVAVAIACLAGTALGTAGPTAPSHVVVALAPGSTARFEQALYTTIPDARIHWRYRLTVNGLSVSLPVSALPRLRSLPGVTRVYPSATYRALEGPDAVGVRADALTAVAAGAGDGVKIGFLDDGVDVGHAFFAAGGFTAPAGFPKGQLRYTSAKVIVARAFAPPGATHAAARLAFDTEHSRHGTHVAGIAAGNAATDADGAAVSGVAPRAWIGNYRVLTIPADSGLGLDGNAPELVAAIEAAVADGMDVINLSLGEPEIEPANDVVALALDAAARSGVVVVVAAGNEGRSGAGTVGSPATAQSAITVGAVTAANPPRAASFSARGPTPLSLRLKPDLVAPGAGILSSVPGGWSALSGTSMAAPHVTGVAALLVQRHPEWTPDDVRASLIATARPLRRR